MKFSSFSLNGICKVKTFACSTTSLQLLARYTSGDSWWIFSRAGKGSKPITLICRCMPPFATRTPILPSPSTPSVLPANSKPRKTAFLASICLVTSASPNPFSLLQKSIARWILRALIPSMMKTSSATALALAPGVLKTQIPLSVAFSTVILLTPAPALATARSDG